MYEHNENGFSRLLDELERHRNKLRKAAVPAQPAVKRIEKVTRSKSVTFKNLMPRHRRDFSGEMDNMIADLNKSMSTVRAATIRLNKPRGTDLLKAMETFNAKLQKAMSSGELSPDEVCRLEAHRNRMLQRPLTGLI